MQMSKVRPEMDHLVPVVLSEGEAKVSRASKVSMISSKEDRVVNVVEIHLETFSRNLKSSLVKVAQEVKQEVLVELSNKLRDKTLS
jgi:predicted DNA-binding protein (UPF0251 family)